MTSETSTQFRFRVDDAFEVTGRGTFALGLIEQGRVHVGDRLRLIRDGRHRANAVCRAIGDLRESTRDPALPVRIGLGVTELSKSDFQPGDLLAGESDGYS
jgi:selenocysteine-specific translation elongation factor